MVEWCRGGCRGHGSGKPTAREPGSSYSSPAVASLLVKGKRTRISIMPARRKPTPTGTKRPSNRPARSQRPEPEGRLAELYPSLAEGPTPAERRANLLQQARARGLRPLTAEMLEAMGEVWPEAENVDEFLAWLRRSRQEGAY